jgi:hypothetical protein
MATHRFHPARYFKLIGTAEPGGHGRGVVGCDGR